MSKTFQQSPFYFEPPTNFFKRLKGLKSSSKIIWYLTTDELNFIKQNYPHYEIQPIIYKIRTQKFENVSNLPSILKELDRKANNGKNFINSKLSEKDLKILSKYNIYPKPYKYLIKTK